MSARSDRFFMLIMWGLLWTFTAFPQSSDFPYDIPEYDFIHYDSNLFIFPGTGNSMKNFMSDFSRLVTRGEGQLSIVHIGGSHLQADIYSNRIRGRLQTFQPGSNAGRGFIFPYTVARTNNPSNYGVGYTGKWTACKNTEENRFCILGLSGISVSSSDTNATISIDLPAENFLEYDFNRVRVFFLEDSLSYNCSIHTGSDAREPDQHQDGIRTFLLDDYEDHLELRLSKTAISQNRFCLFGISLETDDPGIVYHSIGVNGAKVPSFLGCSLLPEQISALSADLVILSLGTNDAYTRYFNAAVYKMNYDSLIQEIHSALPDAAILLTVPNDSYLYRRYTNSNTARVRELIMELASENDCGVWDLYGIMGGLNSIVVWQRFGLAKRDRIHFTQKGYLLIGDLFFNAFLKTYDDYIDSNNQTFQLH